MNQAIMRRIKNKVSLAEKNKKSRESAAKSKKKASKKRISKKRG